MGMKTGGTGKFAKFFAIGASVVAAGAIAAMVVVMMKGSNNKIVSYSATFVANTDPNHNGKIQGSSEKTFTNVNKLDAGYAPDTLDNYQFDYWCTDSELSKKATFPITLSQNEKYYAKWSTAKIETYTVTFNTNGGTTIGQYSVAKGDSISRPETTKSHYKLKAWHENNVSGKEVFKKTDKGYESYTPTGNITLLAEWEQCEFNVALNLNGGTAPYVTEKVKIGQNEYPGYPFTSKIDNVPYAYKENSSFEGWFLDQSCITPVESFPFVPTKDNTILYAKWGAVSQNKLTIIANSGGEADKGYLPKIEGETADPQSRDVLTSYVPYAPTAYYDPTYHDKYILDGWFDAATGGNPIKFPLKVEQPQMTIYAHWTQAKYSAVIYSNEKTGNTTQHVQASWDNLSLCRYADIISPKIDEPNNIKDIDLSGKTGSALDINNYTLIRWDAYNADSHSLVKSYNPGELDITPLTYNVEIYPVYSQTKFTVKIYDQTTKELLKTLDNQTKESLGSKGPDIESTWVPQYSQFKGWKDKSGNPITFPLTSLTADLDLYMESEVAMGRVYLHTSDVYNSSTYNGTADYYYIDAYKSLGEGFAARGLPDKPHYWKVGWKFTSTTDDDKTWKEALDASTTIYSNDSQTPSRVTKWPEGGVRPEAGKIAHLYPTYEQSQFEIKFDVGEEATACSSIWTKDKNSESGKATVASSTTIPESSKTFNKFIGWSLTKGSTTKIDFTTQEFDKDTTVYAIWETVSWKVTFNVLKGTSSCENYATAMSQEGMTQISTGILSDASNYIESQSSLKRTNGKVAGWTTTKPTSENDTWDTSKIIKDTTTLTGDLELYAIYYHADIVLTIYPNGATIDGSTNTRTLTIASESVADKNVWYNALKSQYGEIVAPTDLPNFYGYAAHSSSNVFDFPATITKATELDMIWTNNTKFTVTFDAGNGDFYFKQNEIVRTSPTITYEVDLTDTSLWTESYKPTLKNVYEQAKLKRNCLASDYLINDGYTFEKWTNSGVDLGDDYLITGSKVFDARWSRATIQNWWDDSTGLIISLAEDSSGGTTPVLQSSYSTAYAGTQANKDNTKTKAANTFVGLEKEIKIPTLSTEHTLTTRVIGEWQDKTSDNQKVYLTIQFIDAPISGCYASDSNKDPRYENSVIRNTSIPYLLSAIPNSLTSHFKSVRKPYLSSDTTTTSTDCKTMKCTDESLFVLSAYELGGSTSNGGSAKYENDYKSTYSDYMVQYSYYAGLGDGQSAAVSKRAFEYPYTGTDTKINAWTRTPRGDLVVSGKYSTAQDVYFIGYDDQNVHLGSFCTWDPMSGYGICPAFCIGYTKA